MNEEEFPAVPEPDPEQPPEDQPIGEYEGQDPYGNRDDVVQEDGSAVLD